MLRCVIFDFNGVLVDDEWLHLELFQRVFGEEGVELSEEAYYEKYVGYDDEGCFRAGFGAAGRPLDETLLIRLIARKASYYQEHIRREGFRFFPGAAALVREAASEMTVAVVSGALRQEIEEALSQEHLRQSFKTIVAAEDVERGKPAPDGYLRAVEDLNSRAPLPERLFHPHEIVAIEDTAAGLESAAAAGLLTLAVCHTFPAELLSRADVVRGDLEGLSVGGIRALLEETSRS